MIIVINEDFLVRLIVIMVGLWLVLLIIAGIWHGIETEIELRRERRAHRKQVAVELKKLAELRRQGKVTS